MLLKDQEGAKEILDPLSELTSCLCRSGDALLLMSNSLEEKKVGFNSLGGTVGIMDLVMP